MSGGKTATLANGSYCFHNLTVPNKSVLKVTGPVTIRLTGALKADGTFANMTFVPANLQISSSDTGKNGVKLNGAGGYLTVYAPGTDVVLGGGAEVFGSLLGETLSVSGKSAVHFDVH